MGWLWKLTEFWIIWGGLLFIVTLVSAVVFREVTGLSVLFIVIFGALFSFLTIGVYVIWRVYQEEDFTVPERLQYIDYEEPEDTFW